MQNMQRFLVPWRTNANKDVSRVLSYLDTDTNQRHTKEVVGLRIMGEVWTLAEALDALIEGDSRAREIL